VEVYEMVIRKTFNVILGISDRVEDEKKRFVERVNQIIFHYIDTEFPVRFDYENLFAGVCFELGVDANTIPVRRPYSPSPAPPTLDKLADSDFTKTLEVLCALYAYIRIDRDREDARKWLSERVEAVLSRCTCDIGVGWKNGFFYPSGAEQLDKPLIEDVLTWLKDYPNEEKDYRTALRSYAGGDALADVIKNCYSATEGIARKVLGNDKTLDNNKEALLSEIGLSDGWKRLLANYVTYAHDYRHASEERHEITKQEAEAYLYLTGLIIRLIIESKTAN